MIGTILTRMATGYAAVHVCRSTHTMHESFEDQAMAKHSGAGNTGSGSTEVAPGHVTKRSKLDSLNALHGVAFNCGGFDCGQHA